MFQGQFFDAVPIGWFIFVDFNKAELGEILIASTPCIMVVVDVVVAKVVFVATVDDVFGHFGLK